ncbi:MAG TPA: glycosyltransferase family 4 protein [Verrucomicrobiae bacterium]|jgi:glycosyltransferase involved in cell wall biosynthesis|nr:glycosyltransferase family 4 protein [Verrucomicrobiae bacterium]
MRVSHVITRLIVGGAQENTLSTVAGLAQIPGLDVSLISGLSTGPEGSLEPEARRALGEQNFIHIPELVRPVHPVKDWLALHKLERLLREQKPDIVHTHSAKGGILGRLAAKRARVPLIIHTIHGPSFGPFQGAAANFAFRAAEKYAAGATDHFIVVADAMTEQHLAAGIGRPEQYTKIFSGFKLDPFLSAENDPHLRAKLGIDAGDFVIGKIARLFKLKGHDDLFAVAPEIVRKNPKIKFLLIGGGPWRGRFEELARSHQLEKHFIFTGLVPPGDVAKYAGIMDALVHLSLREGLARALPQALAAGKPVIAYDCDGAREACRDGETGFLIRPGDTTTLTNRLLQLAADPPLCERLGRRGREFVRDNFGVEKMVEDIYNLYMKLAAARHGVPV